MSGFNEMNEMKEISGVRKIIIAGCIIAILLSGGGLGLSGYAFEGSDDLSADFLRPALYQRQNPQPYDPDCIFLYDFYV